MLGVPTNTLPLVIHIGIFCYWVLLHYNMSFKTIAGGFNGAFWWYGPLSEDREIKKKIYQIYLVATRHQMIEQVYIYRRWLAASIQYKVTFCYFIWVKPTLKQPTAILPYSDKRKQVTNHPNQKSFLSFFIYSTSILSLQQKHSFSWKTNSRHHDITLMSMYMTNILLIYEKLHFQELLPFVRVRQNYS